MPESDLDDVTSFARTIAALLQAARGVEVTRDYFSNRLVRVTTSPPGPSMVTLTT